MTAKSAWPKSAATLLNFTSASILSRTARPSQSDGRFPYVVLPAFVPIRSQMKTGARGFTTTGTNNGDMQMVSCDTNILFAASCPDDPKHEAACRFLESHADDANFVVAEQTLVELYCLLRNPVLQKNPLSAGDAVAVISSYRSNPAWAVVDVPSSPDVMNAVWRRAASRNFARRRIHDVRLAETLKYWGVDEFHTRNVRDFNDAGFRVLSNPLE